MQWVKPSITMSINQSFTLCKKFFLILTSGLTWLFMSVMKARIVSTATNYPLVIPRRIGLL